MMRERIIEMGGLDPVFIVSANERIHWARRVAVTRYWRKRAWLQALGARLAPFDRARVVVTIRFPDRRRRDVANYYPYVAKPIVDGLVDAAVLPDDSDAHLVGPDMRRAAERGHLAVFVTIQELTS